MKKLLIIALLFWGCDFAPTEHTHEHEHDTTNEHETESELIDREFVVIKSLTSGLDGNTTISESLEDNSNDCPSDNPQDCAGVCGGEAVEQTYYYDNDGDGLGVEYNRDYCSANVPDNWVLNSDDDDDTTSLCWILYTLNIFEEDLEVTDGYISFTHNQEDYSIDVSSCIEIESDNVTRLVQDTELKVVYAFREDGLGYPFNYSSPNELLFVQ